MKELFTLGPEVLGSRDVLFKWTQDGCHLAAAGSRRCISVCARSGSIVDTVAIADAEPSGSDRQAPIVSLEWDCEGRLLAIMLQSKPFPCLYDVTTRQLSRVEMGLRGHDVTWLAWSKCNDTLAIATSLGSLLLMCASRPGASSPTPKHAGAITCGAWNSGHLVAVGATDNQVSVVNALTGQTIKTAVFKLTPEEVRFASGDAYASEPHLDQLVSVNVGKQTIYLFEIDKSHSAAVANSGGKELAFQPNYGSIESHLWYGNGDILIGFSSGVVLVVSTQAGETTREIYSAQYFPSSITAMALCPMVARAGVAGGSRVEVLELGSDVQSIEDEAIELDPPQTVRQLDWTPDGQILTIAAQGGMLSAYLATLPQVSATWGSRVAFLTSLRQVTILDTAEPAWRCSFHTQEEPALLALSAHLVAMSCGNQVWCLQMQEDGPGKQQQAIVRHERAYGDVITCIAVSSSYVAVLAAGILSLHHLQPGEQPKTIPLRSAPSSIATVAMIGRHDHLLLGTPDGRLLIVDCSDDVIMQEVAHGQGIRSVFPHPAGNKVIYADSTHEVGLWEVGGSCLPIPGFGGPLETALWDSNEPSVFLLSDVLSLCGYAHLPDTLAGPELRGLSSQACPSGSPPLLLKAGVVTLLNDHGSLESFLLDSHEILQKPAGKCNVAELEAKFAAELGLGRLQAAATTAAKLQDSDLWRELAEASVHVKDVDLAIRCYKAAGDTAAVQALFPLQQETDPHVTAAQLTLLLNQDLDKAQEHYLRSATPAAALDMRKRVKQWQAALDLAYALNPAEVVPLSYQRAQELEEAGEHGAALKLYTASLEGRGQSLMTPAINQGCKAGIARCAIQQGDVKRGVAMAKECQDPALCCQCANVLADMQQLQAAAELYEAGGNADAAAALFIKARAFGAASRLVRSSSSSGSTARAAALELQLARAHEGEKHYTEAAEAYRNAGDFESVIRLYLGPLGKAREAADLAKHSGKPAILAVVARARLDAGDYQEAIQFFWLAKEPNEAFAVAERHQLLEQYLQLAGSSASADDLKRAVSALEAKEEFDRAAELHKSMGNAAAAARMYLKGGRLNKALDLADTASRDSEMQDAMRQYLYSVADHRAPAPPAEQLLRLRLLSGNAEEAATTALEAAKSLQAAGEYKAAHGELAGLWTQFATHGVALPPSSMQALALLHSYILVRPLVKLGLHENAARMLLRIAGEIEAFQQHAAAILTSAVVECHRAGLGGAAYRNAAQLMTKPELKAAIVPAYKRKIEGLVRRREMSQDPDEAVAACPHCAVSGPETQLACDSCHRFIPFCLASGRRMVLNDWARCGSCQLPARASLLNAYLTANLPCTLCGQSLGSSSARHVANPRAHLASLSGSNAKVSQQAPAGLGVW